MDRSKHKRVSEPHDLKSAIRNPQSAPASSEQEKNPQPVTKTRLRRGEIAREKNLPDHSAEVIDFLPAVHGDVEDLLCDLSKDAEDRNV